MRALSGPALNKYWGSTDFDPFRLAFRLLTSVRFAISLIAFVTLGALIGVLVPQMPAFVRDDPGQQAAWLAQQQDRFGNATWWLHTLQAFDVFHSYWFLFGLGLLTLSVSVCSMSRFSPTWRSIFRPPVRVPAAYFKSARVRHSCQAFMGIESTLAMLRRRRYKLRIEDSPEEPATYLLADRFSLSPLGTFASHLALVIFLAGGLVTAMSSFRQEVLIPEGQSRPVGNLTSAKHMQLHVESFERIQDEDGFDRDYRTSLIVYRDGKEVASGVTTVNDPMHYDGYVFHQSAFSEDGARLRIVDAEGRTTFDDVLLLRDRLAQPEIVVRDLNGIEIARQFVAPTAFIDDRSSASSFIVDGKQFWLVTNSELQSAASEQTGPPFEVSVLGDEGQSESMRLGNHARLGDYDFTFSSLGAVKYSVVDLPMLDKQALVELDELSSDAPRLLILMPDEPAVSIQSGGYAERDGQTFNFLGQRDFTGLTVKKDPGTTFIWVATALMLGGLFVTFHLPRRRIWMRFADGRLEMAGLGDRTRLGEEMRVLADAIGEGSGDDEQQRI